jgi:hypothetical protein
MGRKSAATQVAAVALGKPLPALTTPWKFKATPR